MRALLIVAAPIALASLPATPAAAEHGGGPSFTFHSGTLSPVTDFRFGPRANGHFGDDPDGRRHRGFGGVLYVDREYQGDTGWRPESFNDWWHERPERSYPAWMRNNQNCERRWWAGSALRC